MASNSDLPVVILCGGAGTRLREETEHKPKPLVEIGEMPVLWHIMKLYSHHGFRRFVLCLGYKGRLIKEFFLDYPWVANDIVLRLATGEWEAQARHPREGWTITFAETGLSTPTGGRLAAVRKYIDTEHFLATYGDGLSDVDLPALVSFHRDSGRLATVTGVHPASSFGVLEVDRGQATSFREKPRLDGLINGGFFAFRREVLDRLGEDSVLEEGPLRKLAAEGQLSVYEHGGFWACMDTFKDVERLNGLWSRGIRPWAVWR